MAAGFALVVASGTQVSDAALLVDVDLRGLGAESSSVSSISNGGTAGGNFDLTGSATAGVVTTVGSWQGGVQGLAFADTKYNWAGGNSPISGNDSYSVTAWVYNTPDIAGEETIVAWGSRGQGDGGNAGFHQGTSGSFGAIGHWGGDYDVPWGDGGNDISPTVDTWTHLAWSYDGTTDSVYINGVLSNTKTFPGDLNVYDGVPFALGSEHDAPDALDDIAIPFSGVMGQVKVWDEAQDAASIQADYDAGRADYVPEPSSAALTLLGLLSFVGIRRRK